MRPARRRASPSSSKPGRSPRSRKAAGGSGWPPRTLVAGVGAGLATLGALTLALILIGAALYWWPGPKARQGGATDVILRRGAGVPQIASALRKAGAIQSDLAFIAAAELTEGGRKLKAGEYAFPSHDPLAAVLARIRAGRVVHHRITVPEGLTSRQVVMILSGSPVLAGAAPTPPEGAILPETYEVVRDEQRSAVLQRMMDARDRLLAQLWAGRKPGLPYTSVGQAVTLASIVERETAVPAERPRVAAVYLNRLRQGIKLDADPTVAYGVDSSGPLGRPLSRADLAAPSPYNTYLRPGLPPTPIGNPGKASLAAVFDPATSKDLYFVADGSGGHAFAETLAQQNANVARWRAIEQSRRAANPAASLAPPPHAAPSKRIEHR